MITSFFRQWLSGALAIAACISLAGCSSAEDQNSPSRPPRGAAKSAAGTKKAQVANNADATQKTDKTETDPQVDSGKAGDGTKRVQVAKNVELEIDGDQRRVLVKAQVCMRAGMLEQFMCRAFTKEHESVLAADVDAKDIHTALLMAGATAGNPVKFRPKYTPASGTVVKIFVQYEQKGKTIKVPAQQWVRNMKTGKQLTHDWVFGGSFLAENRFEPNAPPIYAANEGDVICLTNFETAMLDLPIASSSTNDDLDFDAFTDRIPPLETNVLVILEPVVTAKKK